MTAVQRADSSAAWNQTSATQSSQQHVVEHGDTLSAIAAKAGVSLEELLKANPQILNPNMIYPGDRVNIPAASGTAANDPTAAAASQAADASASSASAANMSLNQKGLDLIKGFEGLRLNAYQDSGGVWTIGYGHTGGVKPGDRITQAQAEQYLRQDTGSAQQAVRNAVKVPLTQNQFDALVSFTYNLGAGALQKSTLLKKLNACDYAGAQAEFGKFVHAGGQVLQGLVRRRAEEAALFGNKGPGGAAPAPAPTTPAPDSGPAPGGSDSGGDYTVRKGDTLWDIARSHGVSLQSLIAANPQIKDPNMIHPGETVHIPGGGTQAAGGSGAPSTGSVGGASPGTPVSGNNAAAIAQQFLGENASELKRSGKLPMDPNVPSNICCANFVSACLQKAGLLPDNLHTNSVSQLNQTLRSRGWHQVDAAHAKPGDVVIIQSNGVSHTVMVEKNENGKLTLIGSNNRNADGSQRITEGSAQWALNNGGVILTPPSK
jgi:spore coat assembly protein SafA